MNFMNNNYDDEYTYESRPGRKRGPMATAAIVLGVLSITLSSVIYISLPCGALAVICAVLSRDRHSMPGRSKAGVVCGIIGMIATTAVTVSAFHYVLTTEEGRSYLEYYYRIYTGDYDFDLDEAFGEIFPFLYDSDSSEEDSSGGSEAPGNDGSQDGGTDDPGTDSPGGSEDSPGSPNEQPGGSSPQQDNSAQEGGFI